MPNILDYLTWRGDVPFSVSPPNEVDNYIHCKIGTLDFTGIVPENELYVPLPQAVEAYFAAGGAEKLRAQLTVYCPDGQAPAGNGALPRGDAHRLPPGVR